MHVSLCVFQSLFLTSAVLKLTLPKILLKIYVVILICPSVCLFWVVCFSVFLCHSLFFTLAMLVKIFNAQISSMYLALFILSPSYSFSFFLPLFLQLIPSYFSLTHSHIPISDFSRFFDLLWPLQALFGAATRALNRRQKHQMCVTGLPTYLLRRPHSSVWSHPTQPIEYLLVGSPLLASFSLTEIVRVSSSDTPFQNALCGGPATKLPSIQSDKYLLSTYCVPIAQQVPPETPRVSKQYSLILPQQELNIIALALFWRLGCAEITACRLHSTPLAWKWGWIFNKSGELNQPEALIQCIFSFEFWSYLVCIRRV